MNIFEEFAVLDAQIDLLTSQKDELKVKIIEDMVSKGKEKEPTAVGNFTISMRKTWTYSNKVAELEEEYKARKAIEEKDEIATFVEKPSLRYTSIKL